MYEKSTFQVTQSAPLAQSPFQDRVLRRAQGACGRARADVEAPEGLSHHPGTQDAWHPRRVMVMGCLLSLFNITVDNCH